MDEQDWAYQCKLCESKFKTTAELQKHRRLNHRTSTITTTTTSAEEKFTLKSTQKPSPSSVAQKIKTAVAEEVSGDGAGHRHGTRYSKARNSKTDGISFGACRHITCETCSHNFDTKDPVVVHLLRQSRNDNGTIKCPFCSKVLLEDGSSPIQAKTGGNGANSRNKQKVDASRAVIPPKDNLSNKRKSSGSLGSEEGNAKKISSFNVEAISPETTVKSSEVASKWKVAPIPVVRQPSLRVQQKRKLSSPVETTTTVPQKKLYNPKPSTPVSALKVKKTFAESTPTAGLVPVRSDQVKHNYEITYRRRIDGTGSRGGSLGGRRKSRSERVNEDDSRSSVEAPLKVSVLINNNPYPSDKRLAVPKGKEFQKGDIRCPYCGFEAKSVREVQFHVNTHMAKSYPCEFCSHVYRSKQGVMNHTEKHHPNEYSNLKDQSSDINKSAMSVDLEADDQRSMSNYSSSMTSDGTEAVENFYEVNQSQESNLENNSNFPVTATYTSYYAPGVQYENEQAYLNSAVGALFVEQQGERDFFMVGQPRLVERVVEMANF